MRRNSDFNISQEVQNRIFRLLDTRKSHEWQGTMTELSNILTRRSVPENWPASPSALRMTVNSILASLRRSGISVSFDRATDHSRRRLVTFSKR